MNFRQMGTMLSAALSYFLCVPSIHADEIGEESQPEQPSTSLTKTQYESEAIALATWKSKVQGTMMGDKLISFLTTLNSNLVRNSRDESSLYNRGYLYGTVGCTRAAIADLTKAIQVDSMSANSYLERGLCYMDLAEYAKANSDLNMAVYFNPLSGDARLARGRLLLLLNKPEQALTDLLACKQEHLQFNPVLPGELPADFYRAPDYYLGACYELLGNYALALFYYREASHDVSGNDNGFIHRYADRPLDAQDRVTRLQSG